MVVHEPSIKFLQCVEDHLLLQMLDVMTGSNTLLDLHLTNRRELLHSTTTNVIVGYIRHNIREFKILLSTLKVTSTRSS